MDNVWWPEARRAEAEDRLLKSLRPARAFLFALGQAVDNEPGARILKDWSADGHRIGNHTYEHMPLSGRITPADFESGILHTEKILSTASGFRKWFRFPALKEGNTRAVRDRLRTFLAQYGYRNGAVTIDASDWYYNQRLLDQLEADSKFDLSAIGNPTSITFGTGRNTMTYSLAKSWAAVFRIPC